MKFRRKPLRKTILSLCAIFALAAPLFAAPPRAALRTPKPEEIKIERLPAGSDLFARVAREYRQNARARHRASAAADIRSVRAFVIPVAGNAPGGGGTFFRSDVTIANYSEVEQDLLIAWIARGVTTTNPPLTLVTIPAFSSPTFRDFVGNVLDEEGIGSIFVVPLFDDEIDLDAAIDGFSRIYTNQPGSAGTVSQPFEAVDPGSFLPFTTANSLGLRHDASFRTNYFIVNADETARTFTIVFAGSTGLENQRSVTVPAESLFFDSVPPGDNYGDLNILFIIDDEDAFWTAGASSTDNITADGYVSIASAVLGDSQLDDFDR
jgi:hypothetical protein